MKPQFLILFVLFSVCFSLGAEEPIHERVYVHTDKDCYVAGETIWLKFYVIDRNFKPSALSKVGYVEICDTIKPQIQLKVALEKGSGFGKLRIPIDIPSGIYQLSGYTRYMRNEGDAVFFRKQIAIVNAGQQIPDSKRFELVEQYENPQSETSYGEKESSGLSIITDQNEYGNRQKVVLSLDNIPANTADLVISVSRNDSIAFVPETNKQKWLKQVRDTFLLSREWLPEYEGHIITGRFVPKPQSEQLLSSIAFVGKDIHYFNGQVNPQDGTANFYTSEISGKQQIVTTVISQFYDNAPYRMDILTPFSESLPDNLPILKIYPNEKQLTERYIGAQIQEKMDSDSINHPIQSSGNSFLKPLLSYDLDQYTRFSTIGETILEFISRVKVSKVGDKRRIKVFLEEDQRFSLRNTLVLLDGIPVYEHEDILNYNPMYVKRINVYDGRYLFGGESFECIVSFQTREGDLPFFQLSDNAQLLNYDCPQLPLPFEFPDYSIDIIKNSRKPDFRSTLYWNPAVEFTKDKPVNLSFYTSDLSGIFKVSVEGITNDGKIVKGISYFRVR